MPILKISHSSNQIVDKHPPDYMALHPRGLIAEEPQISNTSNRFCIKDYLQWSELVSEPSLYWSLASTITTRSGRCPASLQRNKSTAVTNLRCSGRVNVSQASHTSVRDSTAKQCTSLTWLGDGWRRSRRRGICTGDSGGAAFGDGASLRKRIVRVQLFKPPPQVAVFPMQVLFVHRVFPFPVLQVLQPQQEP